MWSKEIISVGFVPLCHDATPMSLTSGLDLRGVNAQVSLRATGITLPTVSAAAQITSTAISCYVLAETKALLKIAPGRVCFAEF
ncbi:hypothetical protein AB1Y20_007766 [Prymnesium parvum]|uniref:Uncharacterized protein n=1 Tax=Prymnesium parvum TaxID=97485 RepID=A0AB34IUL7_PRYPA